MRQINLPLPSLESGGAAARLNPVDPLRAAHAPDEGSGAAAAAEVDGGFCRRGYVAVEEAHVPGPALIEGIGRSRPIKCRLDVAKRMAGGQHRHGLRRV